MSKREEVRLREEKILREQEKTMPKFNSKEYKKEVNLLLIVDDKRNENRSASRNKSC